MKSNPTRFWFVVIALGWAFDFLFWEKPAGINFFLFVLLCLGSGMFLLKADRLRLSPRAGLLLIPIAFLAAVAFFRLEPMTVFLAVITTVFLMGVFALTYIGGNWIRYGMIHYLIGYLSLFASMIARPVEFGAEVRRGQPSPSGRRNFWPFVRGFVIALPIVAVFAALLSSADLIFAERLQEFLDLFNIDNLPEYIFRLVYILLFAYAIAGTFLHAAQKSNDAVEGSYSIRQFLGFTESAIVLGSVVLLFAAFVIVQFQYFFGGNANITLEGYTYSEYARRGFGELVVVAFFSLLMVLGLGAVTKRETDLQRRVFSGLGMVLVGLVLVMLASAYQRLGLYETAYGFSRLRTYTHVFMIWLAVLLISVAALEFLRRERAMGLAMVAASLGFVVSLSLLNVDAFIVRQNIQRELRSASILNPPASRERVDLDTNYFLDLSDDAIPAMAAGFRNKSLPVPVREDIGAALACKLYNRENSLQDVPWQGFHLSRLAADRIFAELDKELSVYTIADNDFPPMVETPGGEEFQCWRYGFD